MPGQQRQNAANQDQNHRLSLSAGGFLDTRKPVGILPNWFYAFRLLLWMPHKQQMIAHTQKFRFFAQIEVITQVLLIRGFIQAVD